MYVRNFNHFYYRNIHKKQIQRIYEYLFKKLTLHM
jgi:hypothetical protein